MAKKKPASAKAAPKKAAAKKPAAKKAGAGKKPPTDWVAVLKSGTDGVAKWNRLTGKERGAATLVGAGLAGAALAAIDLRDVYADGADFTGADLTQALFREQFAKAVFAGATLAEAHFSDVQLPQADFTNAKLARAEFLRAELKKCSFAGADLTGAKLAHSNLCGTDLSTAALADVVWDGSRFDKDTKWPEGFVIPAELKWVSRGTDPRLAGRGKSAAAHDINGLMTRLHATIDEKRMARTIDMLKKQRNQIFSEVEPAMVRGIVKSQRDIDTVYSCVLMEDGVYSCGTADMAQCMGLANEPCKHLLVLVIGLARAGQLDPATADRWIVAANSKGPRWNKTVQNHIADSFLKFRGAQAGEIDWRPTETVPEDFYAM